MTNPPPNDPAKGSALSASNPAKSWELLPKGLPQMRACLDAMKAQIALALPRHLTPERVLRVATTALQTNPMLLECTTLSVVGGIVAAAQLGLEIGGNLGQAYLVPYRVKGVLVASFIPGYRGMIDLSRRSGSVSVIEARVVHKRDKFTVRLGVDATVEHAPYMGEGDPGPTVAVYAVCKMRDGSVQFDVLTKREVESVRKRSKAGDSGPWQTDYEEMAKKSVIRRLWKVLPVSVERAMAAAIAAHDRAEDGNPIDGSSIILEGADVFGVEREEPDAQGAEAPKTPEPQTPKPTTSGESPARRTRRTVLDGAPKPADGDPTAGIVADLVAVHERIRAEDPEAFAAGWKIDIPDGVAPAKAVAGFTLNGFGVDALVAARDAANEFVARSPLPPKGASR